MDAQLRLHHDNLSLFIEPTLKRQSVGHYSVTGSQVQVTNYSQKASLVALTEKERPSQGVIEYEVPNHIEEINLSVGYEYYKDDYDLPNQQHLVQWLQENQEACSDVDIVCCQNTLVKIYKAPYTEATALPWEIKVNRGPDGICYLEENEMSRIKYSEMNMLGKQQIFRQRAFKRYMTIRKGDHGRPGPPKDNGSAFYRVNKLVVDSGTVVYQSEAQCFDINYNSIDLKVLKEGQFDLPSPSVRLNWWSNAHLAGSNTILCGYYNDEDEDNDDEPEEIITHLISFDIKHVKPRVVRDLKFDEEICTASLCTFVQFVKDLTANGQVSSCVLRFEPGSKRICVLDIISRKPSIPRIPGITTQISATDETSSVEATPRTPREDDQDDTTPTDSIIGNKEMNGYSNGGTFPRLRKIPVNEELKHKQVSWSRRSSLLTEVGHQLPDKHQDDQDELNSDEDKYKKPRRRRRRGGDDDEEGLNWFHVSIILVFMVVAFVGLPIILHKLEARR